MYWKCRNMEKWKIISEFYQLYLSLSLKRLVSAWSSAGHCRMICKWPADIAGNGLICLHVQAVDKSSKWTPFVQSVNKSKVMIVIETFWSIRTRNQLVSRKSQPTHLYWYTWNTACDSVVGKMVFSWSWVLGWQDYHVWGSSQNTWYIVIPQLFALKMRKKLINHGIWRFQIWRNLDSTDLSISFWDGLCIFLPSEFLNPGFEWLLSY